MGFARQLYRYLKVATAMVLRAVLGLIFVDLDILLQKRRLRGYQDDLKTVQVQSDAKSGQFCIFVFYEPGGDVSASVRRAVTALKAQGIHVLMACNHPLSADQAAFFQKTCHTVLTRGNTGFDFGACKDAFLWLAQQNWVVQRLGFMNDSVFYASRGLDAYVSNLFGDADVISAFENWGEQYHLNSYGLTLSDRALQSQAVQSFWRDYVPVSNRIHAIEMGEKGLSKAALAASQSSKVLFQTADLYERLKDSRLNPNDELIRLPHPWREAYGPAESQSHLGAHEIAQIINKTSPIHAGAYYFPRHLDCPLFKRDIVYRRRFDFWNVEQWIGEVLPRDEAEEFLTLLRRRGDPASLPLIDKWKYFVGVR